MTKKPSIVDVELLRGPVVRTWGAIGGDLEAACMEEGHNLRNIEAVECCLDADRLTLFADCDRDRASAQAAEAELKRAIAAHGYPKVLALLARRIVLC